MKIGVIQATSQKKKNDLLFQCTKNAIAHQNRNDEVVNFGISPDENAVFSYVETAVNISLLLSSKAIDFMVTGCSSGQGMMLACNSLPSVICGYVQNLQDAFLFGRINGGNAVSFPLGLNFGWLGEINLQCTLDKLFDGDFGCGYPPEDADRKSRDTKLLKQLNSITKRTMSEAFGLYDRTLIQNALEWDCVKKYIMEYGKDEQVKALIESVF